jgi:hypothetical protein
MCEKVPVEFSEKYAIFSMMVRFMLLIALVSSLGLASCQNPVLNSPPPTTGSIVGRVVDSVTGSYIKDATVTLDDPEAIPGLTNDAGSYAIARVKPGLHTVRVFKDSYTDESGRKVFLKDLYLPVSIIAEVKAGAITVADAGLKPTTGVIKGKVKREIRESDPVRGDLIIREAEVSKAAISVSLSETDQPLHTALSSSESGDDKGTYIIRYVREGTYTVSAAKPGFFIIKKPQVSVKAGESVAVDFLFK